MKNNFGTMFTTGSSNEKSKNSKANRQAMYQRLAHQESMENPKRDRPVSSFKEHSAYNKARAKALNKMKK